MCIPGSLLTLDGTEHGAHVAVDKAQRGLVVQRVVCKAGTLPIHVDRVVVCARLAGLGVKRSAFFAAAHVKPNMSRRLRV